ncbi:MAG: universal stress protein [Nitrospira sp.]|nr:universal stress protein [Nitrospira sp.]
MRASSHRSVASILLPTDFQQPARRACTYALKLANIYGARLKIVHVIKTLSESSQVSPDHRSLDSIKTSALLELGRLTRLAQDAGIHAEPRLLYGIPGDCILEAAARVNAGLIVMGTHGRMGWDRLRLGSTAQAVVRKASCPVLTLQDVVARDSFRHHAKVSLARLLVATDFSSCADAALRYVSGLALRLKAQLHLVHVSEEGTAQEGGKRKLKRLLRRLEEDGMEASGISLPGDPLSMILKQAEQWQADVIVAGTQGRRGLSRLLLGSVAEGLLGRAACPVLIVRKASHPLSLIDHPPRSVESR